MYGAATMAEVPQVFERRKIIFHRDEGTGAVAIYQHPGRAGIKYNYLLHTFFIALDLFQNRIFFKPTLHWRSGVHITSTLNH